jgi:hypothetical protein
MSEDSLDFSGFETSPTDGRSDIIAQINVAGSEYERLTGEIAALTAQLKQLESELTTLTDITIPELMVGMESITIANDMTIKVKPDHFASCPAASTIASCKDQDKRREMLTRRSKLFAWLDNNGHGSIINREVTVVFNRSQEELAKQVEAELRNKDKSLLVQRNYAIHPQTLNKFVREALEEGIDIPADIFGLHERRVAKFIMPKGKND